MATSTHYTGLIERYRDRLPVSDSTRIISIGEGDTPLIQLQNIPKLIGKDVDIYVKYEGLNPTGSFKDRGMTMAVTKAVEDGSEAIVCASTGNTSASAAAYAVRAGITAFVLIPEGKIAQGKLAQTLMYGAQIIQIRGNFDQGMSLVKEVADHAPVTIVNSINPFRIDGQKTAAFEIVDALGKALITTAYLWVTRVISPLTGKVTASMQQKPMAWLPSAQNARLCAVIKQQVQRHLSPEK